MITYLGLRNFKCFKSLELDFSNITLITGINGMGKSSVIQSLLLLRQSFDERYLQTENKVLLSGQLTELVSGEDLRYVLADSLITSIEINSNDIESKIEIEAKGADNILSCKLSNSSSLFNQNLFSDSFQYIAAERLGPKLEYSKTSTGKHKGRLGSGATELAASYLFRCLSENKKVPIAALKFPGLKSEFVYDHTNAWLSFIAYEGTSVSPTEKTQDKIELRYSFSKGKYSGKDFLPVNVGFGFSYILPIILAVISAESDSLLLIENPEAHMHPAAQSRIGKLLALAAQNGVQIIAETHSDHLLNALRVSVRKREINPNKAIIYYFNSEIVEEEDKHYKETIKINREGTIDAWPKNFFDEWDNNLIQLI